MTPDDEQPEPRRRGRPPGSVTDTDRWRAHTDAQRKAALAKLRMMRDRFERAEATYVAATAARQDAAARAYEVGLGDREIGRELGVNAGNVARLRRQAAEGKGVSRHAETRVMREKKRAGPS